MPFTVNPCENNPFPSDNFAGHGGAPSGPDKKQMTHTKSDSIESLSKNGINRIRSVELVNSLFEIIKKTLEEGGEVGIRGFGKFRVCNKTGFTSKSLKNSSFVPADAKRVVIFRCSPAFEDKINKTDRDS